MFLELSMCFILKIIYTFVSLLMLVLFLLFTCPANQEACQESGTSLILTSSVVSGTQGKKSLIITFLFVDDYSDFFLLY